MGTAAQRNALDGANIKRVVEVDLSGAVRAPASAALADGAANPTTTTYASDIQGFNGTTWDRLVALADNADAVAVGTLGRLITTARSTLFNGTTWDRMRSATGTTGIAAVNTEGTKATYSAYANGVTPVATPTDFWNMFGSATKTIRVLRVEIGGDATAANNVPTLLVVRSSAGTLGSAVLSAVAAVPHDSNNAAATATVNTVGTANYTTLGTLVGSNLRADDIALGVVGGLAASEPSTIWDFTTRNGQGIVLRGVAQQIALNWIGVAVPTGTKLTIGVEWTEES